MKKILVIGSGAWGCAIANLIANNSNKVYLASIEENVILDINQNRENSKYLPNIKLSKNIEALLNYQNVISEVEAVFIVTPAFVCEDVFSDLLKYKNLGKINEKCNFVICSKGLDPKNLDFLSNSFEKITGIKKYAVLLGPNFAVEVAKNIPSVTTIAAINKKTANEVSEILENDFFKCKISDSPITAEICGVIKNIMAIGCGIVEGLGLGVNTKSALILQGIEEIQKLCQKFEVSQRLDNPAGFGDIFLTCSSAKSRNNSLGVLLSQGKSYKKIVEENNKTYEGAISASSTAKICKKLSLNLPLSLAINEILQSDITVEEIKEKILKAIF